MEIIYYKSAVCPKCIPTSRFLKNLKNEYPQITVKEVEVLAHLRSTVKDKVYSIPVIEVNGQRFYTVPDRERFLKLLGLT